jgi:hypothetical protein
MAEKKSSREIPVETPQTQTVSLRDEMKGKDKVVETTEVKEKDLSRTDMTEAEKSGIQTHGDPGAWKTICKAWNDAEGWMKSTKAMQVGAAGCLIQVTTQQKNADGTYAVAEAVCFAERVNVVEEAGVAKLV